MFPRGLLREYASLLSVVARLLDVFAVTLAAFAAFYWRFETLDINDTYQVALFIAALLVAVVFPGYGVYQSWRGKDQLSQLRAVSAAWLTVVLLLVVIAFLTKSNSLVSRQWLIAWALFGWLFLIITKNMLGHVLQFIRTRGLNRKYIVVLGAGELGLQVVRHLKEAAWTGLEIAAIFDDMKNLSDAELSGIPIISSLNKITDYIKNNNVDEAWIALPLKEEERVVSLINELEQLPISIRMVPDIFGFRLLNHSLTEVAGLPIVNLSVTPMLGINRLIKALEDRVLGFMILCLISPLMVVIAIGVKISSPGPVFYRQERVGWNGKPFMMLKFRSMPVDIEQSSGAVWARKGENRATPFGAFLRKTSLDELPQFVNVIKGDMSVVGPRPERPIFVEKFKHQIPGYMKKHLVKAGITGWAQVNGWRGDTDLEKRIEFDLYYIDHWSLWFDFKIIALTIVRGFVHKNAY